MVLFGQKWLFSFKLIVFRQTGCFLSKCLCSCKLVVIGQKCCIRANVFVFGQSGCIWSKVVVDFGKFGFIPAKWRYLRKVVVLGKNGLYWGKSGCVRAKVVVFGLLGCIR